MKIGTKVRCPFIGVDSGATGRIVSRHEVKTDYRGIPVNVPGAYKPVNWKKETAVKIDGGTLVTLPRTWVKKL